MNLATTLSALRKYFAKIACVSLVMFLSATILTGLDIYTNKVYITDENGITTNLTQSSDIDIILKENGYTVSPDDKIIFDGFENNVGEIEIIRAFDVEILVDNTNILVPVTDGNVNDTLLKANVNIGPDDILNMKLDETVSDDTIIQIKRVTYMENILESTIPFETMEVSTHYLAKGTSEVEIKGETGIVQTVVKNMFINGQFAETEVLNETVVKEAKDEVIAVGTASAKPVSPLICDDLELDENGVPVNYSNIVTGRSAGYSARVGAKTASGRNAIVGHVAVDPKVIPYGTELYIASTDGKHVYGYAIAADTGLALLDGRIIVDLFFDSYDASAKWEIKNVNIFVLD